MSLFTWNALLGAFGGLLLCIHQDIGMHVKTDCESETTCADTHENTVNPGPFLAEDKSCVDVELIAELLPATRLKSEMAAPPLPAAPLVALIEIVPLVERPLAHVYKSIAARAPPQARWLTDIYLQTTVLRV